MIKYPKTKISAVHLLVPVEFLNKNLIKSNREYKIFVYSGNYGIIKLENLNSSQGETLYNTIYHSISNFCDKGYIDSAILEEIKNKNITLQRLEISCYFPFSNAVYPKIEFLIPDSEGNDAPVKQKGFSKRFSKDDEGNEISTYFSVFDHKKLTRKKYITYSRYVEPTYHPEGKQVSKGRAYSFVVIEQVQDHCSTIKFRFTQKHARAIPINTLFNTEEEILDILSKHISVRLTQVTRPWMMQVNYDYFFLFSDWFKNVLLDARWENNKNTFKQLRLREKGYHE